jgi:hypothetical protein
MIKKYTDTVAIFTFPGVGGAYPLPHYGTPEADIPELSTPAEARAWSNSLKPTPPAPTPPTEEELLNRAKASEIDRLKSERDAALVAGFDFEGNHYQTRNAQDVANITNVGLNAKLALITSQPFSTTFIPTNNIPVTFDAATAAAWYDTMMVAAQTIWTEYGIARATVEAWTEIPQPEEPVE